ncbi:hypothetical protein GW17_00059185 [Ensete ventricosum]|nr:hypothetical protein GW17_00059185 [Ensete ventricosum]
MFRPLLSSVPATTFYVGKTTHGTAFSRSLSQIINHNASTVSDLNYAPDVEDSDHTQSDLAGESEKIKDSKTQEVPMSNFDEISEDTCHHALSGKLRSGTKGFDRGMNKEGDVQELESSVGETALQSSDIAPCSGSYVACLICGKCILIIDVDGYKDICQECAAKDKLLDSRGQRGDPDKATDVTGNDSLDSPDSKAHLQMVMAEHPEKNHSESVLGQHQCNSTQDNFFPDNCPPQIAIDVGLEHLPEQVMNSLINIGDQPLREQLMNSLDGESPKGATGSYIPQLSNPTAYSSHTFDIAEGTGISTLVMLRSSSVKRPAVQRRAYSATSIICSDPSYSRDNFSGMKRNTGRESSSASSSIDLGSSAQTVASRKTDICVLRQSSRRIDEHAHGETPTYMDDLQGDCSLTISDEDILVSASESNCAKHPHCKPHATVEAPRRSMQRTFTLEEATDAVLFCSSIVHDLACKAAAIGMEKEMAASEASRSTVTRLAKSISYQMDFRNTSNKCVLNSRKVKRKRLEIDIKKPSMDLGNDNYLELVSSSAEDLQTIDSMKPPKLESKCNCTVM